MTATDHPTPAPEAARPETAERLIAEAQKWKGFYEAAVREHETACAERTALETRLAAAEGLADAVRTFNETLGNDPVAVDYARDDMDDALAAWDAALASPAKEGELDPQSGTPTS
jgi:hypothetical protein